MIALSSASFAVLLSGCAVSRREKTPNSFAWFDLVTTDSDVARAFYADMFGWTFGERQSDGAHTIRGNGEALGGLYTAADVGVDADLASQWLPIMSVTDVPQANALALQKGARVVRAPFESSGETFSAIRDPQGALLVLYDGPYGFPLDGAQKLNTWSWADLLTNHPSRSKAFYGSVFGFQTQRSEDQTVFTSNGKVRGGIVDVSGSRVDPSWLPYVAVASVSEAVARSRELGGGPYAVTDDAAVLLDPTGAAIGVTQV